MGYVSARLQTPEDANGRRRDIHLETTSNNVKIVNKKTGVTTDLTEEITKYMPVQISREKPKDSCLWIRDYDTNMPSMNINGVWIVNRWYTTESEMNKKITEIPIGSYVLVYDPTAAASICNGAQHGVPIWGRTNNIHNCKIFCYAAPGTSADTPASVASF